MEQWSGKQYSFMTMYNRISDNDINETVLWEQLGSNQVLEWLTVLNWT